MYAVFIAGLLHQKYFLIHAGSLQQCVLCCDKATMLVARQCHVKHMQQTTSKTTEQNEGLFPGLVLQKPFGLCMQD